MVFQSEGHFQQFTHCKFKENVVRLLFIPTLENGDVFLVVNKYGKVALYETERLNLIHTYCLDLSVPMHRKEVIFSNKITVKPQLPSKCQRTHLVVDAVYASDIKSVIFATTKSILQCYDIGEIETQSLGLEILPRKEFMNLLEGVSPMSIRNKGHVETHRVFDLEAPPSCMKFCPSCDTRIREQNVEVSVKSGAKLLIGDSSGGVTIILIDHPKLFLGKRKVRGFLHKISLQAPFSKTWSEFARIGTRVEIPNPFVVCSRPVYWVGTIKSFAGYKALVDFETFDHCKHHFAWISFCSDVPKPIGYCTANNILLYPPYDVANTHPDFLNKLKKVLSEENEKGLLYSVKGDHKDVVEREILSQRRFKLMQTVEAMDCANPHGIRLAQVTGVIGDRVHITYVDKNDVPLGFWFNVKSDRIHEVGWCQTVGYKLYGVPKRTSFKPLSPESFPPYPKEMKIEVGRVFEVIHPLHLDRISAAHVLRIYNYGYFMARMTLNPPLSKLMDFCFHITSGWILPCGFASKHGIPICAPAGEVDDCFTWESYCEKTKAIPLDLSPLKPKPITKHAVGSKMEAVDLRQPTFCGPVTVVKVADHLLQLHFDGWKKDNPMALQWVDSESCELYPAGWSEMVGHEFQSCPEHPPRGDKSAEVVPVAGCSSSISQAK